MWRSEYPEVFAAATGGVFLAAPAKFEDVADQPFTHQIERHMQWRRPAGLMRDRQLEVPHLARPDDFVGLDQIANEGLLHIDVTALLGRRENKLMMPIEPARPDGHDIEVLLCEHFAIVGVAAFRAGPQPRHFDDLIIVIGNGGNVAARNFLPDLIDAVTIVATSRAADNSDAVEIAHCSSRVEGQGSREESFPND